MNLKAVKDRLHDLLSRDQVEPTPRRIRLAQ